MLTVVHSEHMHWASWETRRDGEEVGRCGGGMAPAVGKNLKIFLHNLLTGIYGTSSHILRGCNFCVQDDVPVSWTNVLQMSRTHPRCPGHSPKVTPLRYNSP